MCPVLFHPRALTGRGLCQSVLTRQTCGWQTGDAAQACQAPLQALLPGSSDATFGWALSLPWSPAVLLRTVAAVSSLCPSRLAVGWHFGSGFGC